MSAALLSTPSLAFSGSPAIGPLFSRAKRRNIFVHIAQKIFYQIIFLFILNIHLYFVHILFIRHCYNIFVPQQEKLY